ncbi:MAG UNVERIFIED_CONTAM: hypothetical protein LVR18_07230 [Planctomycetaceae bacterium]
MLLRMAMPMAASVIPRDSTIDCWPAAVAPLCDPIAGTINGLAPCSRNHSPQQRIISGMLLMPRLPTGIATSPAGTQSPSPES